MQLQIGVKILIKNDRGLYLFLKRSELLSTDTAISWDIPGGRINPEEKLQDALVREVSEEIHHHLKNQPTLIKAQDIFVEAKNLHVVRLTYTTTEVISDIILSDEHEDYIWRHINDIEDLNVEPYLREVLDALGLNGA
jgi:8-oxo-dGTP diphosphatase